MGFMHGGTLARVRDIVERLEQAEDDAAIAGFLLAKRRLGEIGLSFATVVRDDGQWPDRIEADHRPRIRKILGLTDSDKEGESIAAFLMTRRLLARLQIRLIDILDLEETGTQAIAALYPNPQAEVMALRKEVRRLRVQLAEKSAEATRYKSAFHRLAETAWDMQHERLASPDAQPAALATH